MLHKGSYTRVERVEELLRRELSEILQRRVKDPRLQNCVVTRVQMSNDLRVAQVWLSVYPPEEIPEAEAALEKAAGFLRREVSKRLDLRRAPELRFEFDEGPKTLLEMDLLLRSLEKSPPEDVEDDDEDDW